MRLRPRMTPPVRVLTYNVSWEATTGTAAGSARGYGKKCAASANARGKNNCYRNVLHTCSRVPYDFIGLQESNLVLQTDVVEKLNRLGQGSYELISRQMGITTPCIIYNTSRFSKLGQAMFAFVKRSNGTNARGRPAVGQLFLFRGGKEPVAFINMHAPHDRYGLRDNITQLLKALQTQTSSPISRVIVTGDYNKEHLNSFVVPASLRRRLPFQPLINTSNRIPTAWDLQGTRGTAAYTAAVDNVLLAGGVFQYGPETWHSKARMLLPKDRSFRFSTNTSDHSPVASILRFFRK